MTKVHRKLNDAERSERAITLSKKFLNDLYEHEFFKGSVKEGLSARLKILMKERFDYFIYGNRIMKGPVGRLCVDHIHDFITNVFDYQRLNNQNMSDFDLCKAIRDFEGHSK